MPCQKRNKKRVRIRSRRFYWIGKWKVAKGCVDCGYNKHPRALDLDHVDANDKSDVLRQISKVRGDGGIARLADFICTKDKEKNREHIHRLVDEIRKCAVRCKNCHSIRTHEKNQYASRFKLKESSPANQEENEI